MDNIDFRLEYKYKNTILSLSIYIDNIKIWYMYISIDRNVLYISIFNILPEFQKKWYWKKVINYLSQYYIIEWQTTESARFFWEKVWAKFTSLSNFIIWARYTHSQVDLRKWLKM